MAEVIMCNGKYYVLDTRTYNTLPFGDDRVVPDPEHPEWTYTYIRYTMHDVDNGGFPSSKSTIFDIKTGLGGDLELNKDWDVDVGLTPNMHLKFRWQYRVDSGTPTADVGMALYCNKEPINNANYDAFWENPGGSALKYGLKICAVKLLPSDSVVHTSDKANAIGIALWGSEYFADRTYKSIKLFAGTVFDLNNQTTGGQIVYKTQAPTTPPKEGDDDEGGIPTPPTVNPQGEPNLPNINIASGTGITLSSPTSDEIKQLNKFLWSKSFYDNILKIQQDPLQAVLGLYITDCPVPVDGRQEIVCGNVDTGISANAIRQSFMVVDCGEINVDEEYGSYLDYSPFKQAQLYLPHIGFVDIDNDIIQNNTIHVKYHVSLIDGQALCYVSIKQNRFPSFSEVYKTFPCSVYSQVPMSAYDVSAKMQSFINTVTSSVLSFANSGSAGALTSAVGGAVSTAMTKNKVEKSGALTDMAGLMGMKRPCLILYTTPAYMPSTYTSDIGSLIGTSDRIANIGGLCKIINPRIDFSCPKFVSDKLESILTNGVIWE